MMTDYLSLSLTVFLINIIPAFMPPTWLILALAKVNDNSADPITLTLIGAFSSTLGRAVLSFYSGFFRRFFSKQLSLRADEIKSLFDKKGSKLFIGTFLYSLSPFPSNLIFIAKGLAKLDSKPIFTGFFFGRLVSYFSLVVISDSIFSTVLQSNKDAPLKEILDVIGIIAAFSIFLIDWKKVFHKNPENSDI